uniref:Gustatory receptor 18 n=1 Tax=Manduca sexta TaxID=7130 RepID=A0A5K8B1B2_MANSE|nr:TPA: Gustatory receptor 18 [Manduca sexta]
MSSFKKAVDIWYKNVSILGLIKVLKFITAHYFYTGSCKFVKCVYLLYCIVLCVVSAYGAFPLIPFRSIEYVLSVIISLLTADDYIFRYFRSLETLDVVMGIKSRSIFNNKVRCLVAYMTLFRILFLFIHYSGDEDVYSLLSYNIPLLNQRIDSFVSVVIFYTLLVRMKILRVRFERNPIPINIVNKNNVMNNINEVRRCLLDYNNLLDNFHDIEEELQYLMAIIIIFCMPKLITLDVELIGSVLLETWDFSKLMLQIEVTQGFILVCLPAVIADLLRHEVAKIKKTLLRQAISCSDESLRYELELALDYVTRRPFNFVLFGAVPLNMDVPVGIISTCITFIIVTIQFTHFNNI